MLKSHLFLVLISFIIGEPVVYSQKTDSPILKLESPCYKSRAIIAFDSISNISTSIQVFTVDHEDNCVPVDYRITIIQKEQYAYYLLAFSSCGENGQVYMMSYRNPDVCMY